MSIRQTRHEYMTTLFGKRPIRKAIEAIVGLGNKPKPPKPPRAEKKIWRYSVHDPSFSTTSGSWWNRIGQVEGFTRSHARSEIKKRYGLKRVPVGSVITEAA